MFSRNICLMMHTHTVEPHNCDHRILWTLGYSELYHWSQLNLYLTNVKAEAKVGVSALSVSLQNQEVNAIFVKKIQK